MTEIVVTSKGQVTIPIKLRRKFGIKVGSKVEIAEQEGIIVIKKCPSILNLAGSGAGKSNTDELKRMLDQMREEDTLKESV